MFAAALGCAGLTHAQNMAQAIHTDAIPEYKGIYYLETGDFVPAAPGTEGVPGACGEGTAYNNSALSGFFFNGNGATLLSNGQMPTIAPGNSPNYNVRGFEVAYASDQLTTDFNISFWQNGGQCMDFAALGTPTASFSVINAPGSSTLGTIEVSTIYLDLGALAFDLWGDGNGINGDADGDLFGWGIQFPQGLDGISVCGEMMASDPDNCAAGAGTFADYLGCDNAGTGSGLGTTDAFVREADGLAGPGCFWFGGYPANPYASFFLKVSSSNQGDSCVAPRDIGSAIGQDFETFDTSCNATSGFDGGGLCSSGASSINQDVFFRWTAPSDGDYVIDVLGSSFDTKMAVHAGGDCNATCVDYNDDSGGLQSSISLSGVLMNEVFLIQVGGYGSSAGAGDLSIEAFIDPCANLPVDFLEDNDDCGMEAAIDDGSYSALTVSHTDWDYYSMTVADGDTLTIDLTFIHADGDMDMFLYDAAACIGYAAGNVGTTGALAWGYSASDNETLAWTNLTGTPQNYVLKVNVYPPSSPDCNTYDMVVDGVLDVVGTSFCSPANLNSTGNPGSSIAIGSDDASDNDVTILSYNLPTHEAGYLLNSMNTGSTPVASGILCLGAGKGRHITQIANSGAGGTISTPLNLTMLPRSVGSANVMAGETWYFQLWHRDHGGTSNFTDAVCVSFN